VPSNAAIRHDFRFLEAGTHESALIKQVSDPSTHFVFIAEPKRAAPADWNQLCRVLDSMPAPAPLIVVGSGAPADSEHAARATGVVDSVSEISPELIRTLVDWQQRHSSRTETPKDIVVCARKSVLVADDNEMNREVAGKMLKLDGHTVLEAQTGDEALEKLLSHDIDVALLDVNMPEQDGIEVCKLYQATVSAESRAVIVALTADISEETRNRCLAAGMFEVLHKPLALEELRNLLARTDTKDRGTTRVSSTPRVQEEALVFDADRVHMLIDMFGLDAFSNKILPRFEREVREGIEQLKSHISDSYLQNTKQLLHATKSSARTIGAVQLARCAARLEEVAANGSTIHSYDGLQNELSVFVASCRELISKQSGANIVSLGAPAKHRRKSGLKT
jgi:CheY-like chemotaxis protein